MGKKRIKPKILVVDDDPDMRIFFSTLLRTGGFSPIVARDGIEGLKKAKHQAPEYIILDVSMTGNGGIKMYQCLKQDKKMSCIPVMMVSSIDRQTFIHYQKTKGIGQNIGGPDAFLEKPPEAAEVLELIQKTLALRH